MLSRLGLKSLIFILIVNVTSIQGMEVMRNLSSLYNSFSTVLSSLTPSFASGFSRQEPKGLPISKLGLNKKDFEVVLNSLKSDLLPATTKSDQIKQNLHLNLCSLVLWQDHDLSFFSHYVRPHISTIQNNPNNFLLSCYYQKHHEDCDRRSIEMLISDPDYQDLLNQCKEARVDNYSALGAAIAARDIDIQAKRSFIQQLIDHDFELTEKDKLLAVAELQDEILIKQKMGIISLLHGKDNLSVLPQDVRKYIIDFMIDIFKETSYPLFNVCPKLAA